MGMDPCNGDVYIFLNKARNRIKLLHWESGGMELYSKILEAGTFGTPPDVHGDTLPNRIEWRDLVMLVEGIMENLPVKENHIYPQGTTSADGKLKDEYVEIWTDISCRIEKTPAKIYVEKTIRHKVMLKADKEKFPEERKILTSELPLSPVEKSMAGASVLADLVIGKFLYHLPFHRQIQQYKECGFSVSPSTMGGWYEAAVEKLKLLYDPLRRQILSSEYVQVDESVIPVLDDERHKARKGYMWCVRDGISGNVAFYYDRGRRSAEVANSLIGPCTGFVQSDGYEVYERFERIKGVTMCGCWAHVRRKFTDTLEENKTLASIGVNYIGRLYQVESEADDAGLTPEQRCEKRTKEAYPVIQRFEKWMEETYSKVLPQSRMGKAIAYTFALLPRLSRYVNDGRINIDNNLIENSIRPLAIGRKNYLFCGNDASAHRAAIVYSLIGSCKAAGVDPREWMEYALRKIPYYQRDGKELSELLPLNWKTLEK